MKILILLLAFIGCGPTQTQHIDNRTTETERIKQQVLYLQGVIAQINSFVASDFTTCSGALPPLQQKYCQIAQTAVAEQTVLINGMLSSAVQNFQDRIYGEDCTDTIAVGCPVAGSIMDQLDAIDPNDIAALQADVTALENDVANITSRLNDFNGSGNTVETVVSGLESDVASLDSRLDDLEQTVNAGAIYRTYFLCDDIANSGPRYEPVLMTGDFAKVIGYINTNNQNGMGVFAEIGDGDIEGETEANSKKCRFKVYDLTTSLKICWNNTNRNATYGSIDTVCDASNNFTTPTAACTCRP